MRGGKRSAGEGVDRGLGMTRVRHAVVWQASSCSVQIPNSDLSFPREGVGGAVSRQLGLGRAAQGSLFRLLLVGYVFAHFSLCTSYLGSESKPGRVRDGSLLGLAQSNQGGWLAPRSVRESRGPARVGTNSGIET